VWKKGLPVTTLRKISVLVADDSAVVRKRLCRLLEEAGQFKIVGAAARAVDAWLLAQSCRPDAVVLDIQLPDASGLDVLRLIKRAQPSCAVLMLTDESPSDYREACGRWGAGDPLLKSREFERVPELLIALASRPPVATATPSTTSQTVATAINRPTVPRELGSEPLVETCHEEKA
jgi:DNA-binding NarL/FixJ family response regulator